MWHMGRKDHQIMREPTVALLRCMECVDGDPLQQECLDELFHPAFSGTTSVCNRQVFLQLWRVITWMPSFLEIRDTLCRCERLI